MEERIETIVTKEECNQRLDAYIAKQALGISRTMVQKLVEEGNITVNGKQEKPSYKVKEKDTIRSVHTRA